jgi:hypothetical protein
MKAGPDQSVLSTRGSPATKALDMTNSLEEAALQYWQMTREQTKRGIVEVIHHA